MSWEREQDRPECPQGAPVLWWPGKDKSVIFDRDAGGNIKNIEWVSRDDPRLNFIPEFEELTSHGDVSGLEPFVENCLYTCDNIHVLRFLARHFRKKAPGQRIKCIYIDPPYNTGRARTLDDMVPDIAKYDDALDHGTWLTMMRDRLLLMKEILADDGFLVVQIDDNEFARLFLLVEEIFGEGNVKTIVVKMAEPTGVKMSHVHGQGTVPRLKEYLLLAGKSGIHGLNPVHVPKREWDPEYSKIVEGVTREEMRRLREIIADTGRGDADLDEARRIVEKFKIYDEGTRGDGKSAKVRRHLTLERYFTREGIKSKKDRERFRRENAWRIFRTVESSDSARKIADAMRDRGTSDCFLVETPRKKLYIIKRHYNTRKKKPRFRILLANDYLNVHPGDFWDDIKTTGLDKEGLVTFTGSKKPERLIERILLMTTREGDLVLDCFAGSGTTGAVAHKMARKWIMVEAGLHGGKVAIERMRNVVDGTDDQGISRSRGWKGGGGFRVYRIARNEEPGKDG